MLHGTCRIPSSRSNQRCSSILPSKTPPAFPSENRPRCLRAHRSARSGQPPSSRVGPPVPLGSRPFLLPGNPLPPPASAEAPSAPPLCLRDTQTRLALLLAPCDARSLFQFRDSRLSLTRPGFATAFFTLAKTCQYNALFFPSLPLPQLRHDHRHIVRLLG